MTDETRETAWYSCPFCGLAASWQHGLMSHECDLEDTDPPMAGEE